MTIPEVTLEVRSVRSNSPDPVGQRFSIQRSPSVVGRAADCEVVLKDPTVSRLHLRIDLESDRICLTSLSRRSQTVVDGRRLDAGARFESRYRPLSIIVGTVECSLDVSFETPELGYSQLASELTDVPTSEERTLDVPGLNAPPRSGTTGRLDVGPRLAPAATPAPAQGQLADSPAGPPFFHVIEGRASAAVSLRGKWLELPRMTALALSALCRSPGVPVAEEIIERASGSESMVTKHISIIRSAIRDLIERGDLQSSEILRQIGHYPGHNLDELSELSVEELMRKFISSRRGFGYILHVRADEVVVELTR